MERDPSTVNDEPKFNDSASVCYPSDSSLEPSGAWYEDMTSLRALRDDFQIAWNVSRAPRTPTSTTSVARTIDFAGTKWYLYEHLDNANDSSDDSSDMPLLIAHPTGQSS